MKPERGKADRRARPQPKATPGRSETAATASQDRDAKRIKPERPSRNPYCRKSCSGSTLGKWELVMASRISSIVVVALPIFRTTNPAA